MSAVPSGAWTSLLSTSAAAGLRTTGFEPAGDVMGSMVQQLSVLGANCGLYGSGLFGAPVLAAPGGIRFGPYADALNRGYATAMARITREATEMRADGIVGITLKAVPIGNGVVEFTALGTAVRAPGSRRHGRVFTTALSGADVAKLMSAGWLPAALVFGVSVSIRHDDWRSRQQTSWAAGNTEVDGYTQLLGHTRADARDRFVRHTAKAGADGAIVSSMAARMWSIEPSENHRDHVAEAQVFGTALARFATPAPAPALTILPLRHTQPGSTR
jgi:uncharacterized protein YbjQ (UPF0145 family)